jgi:outer membrane protein TolC
MQRHKKNIFSLFAVLLYLLNWTNTQAQEQTENLTLDQALEIASKSNWDIRKSEFETQVAEASFKETNALFLPKIQLSETVVNTNDPLQVFGIKLKQQVVEQNDFNPDLLNNPNNITNFNTRLEVMQPLINLDGMWGRKAAQNQILASKMKGQRSQEYVHFAVKKAYFGLQVAQRQEKILQTALKAAESHYQMAQDKKEAGYMKESDVLAVQIHVLDLQNKIAEAQNNIQTASEQFAFLLGIDAPQNFVLTDKLTQNTSPIQADTSNIETRADMKAYQYGIEARKNMLKASKSKFLPSLNAFGSFEINDKALIGDASNYMVGLKLNWTIFNGSKTISQTQKAKATLNKTALEYEEYISKNKLEIAQSKRNITLTQLKIKSNELAVKQAKENLRIRKDRFVAGLESNSDLLTAEALLAQKELELLNALYTNQVAGFYLDFLTVNTK